MNVYVFGNQDLPEDNLAFEVAHKISNTIEGVNFLKIKPNQDLPFTGEPLVIIMDVIQGIDKIQVIEGNNLDKLVLSPRTSVHDFDLAFQLKYLKKIGKLGEIKIIGLPQQGNIDYNCLHSILRKLVAHDIQGS